MLGEHVKTVLIVEDDTGLREALSDCLRDQGYRVVEAENGRAALDWLHTHDPPCLILLDLWMPVMTGEEFRRAQLHDPALAGIPVVVVSALRDGGKRVAGLGVNGYLAKPIPFDDLMTTIQEHC